MSAPKIYQCFLSQLTSEQCLMHSLRIYDPITKDVDEVYISDSCYRIVCSGKDEIAAQMWSAYKQAISGGYSDASFISTLKNEARRLRLELMVVVSLELNASFLSLMTKPISAMSGDLRLWCLSRTAMPPRITHSAEKQIRTIIAKPQWGWIDGRWLVATPADKNGNISRAEPPWDHSLYEMTKSEWGNPPDLFQYMAGDQTLPGYELIRRSLL